MTKRGVGSIQRTGHGRYTVQVTIPDSGNKKLTRRVSGSSRDAEKVLTEMLAEAQEIAGLPVAIKLRQFWECDFLPHCEAKGLQRSTIAGYISLWNNHIESALGDKDLDDISPRDISKLLSGFSNSTAKHVKALLSSMFSFAEEVELVKASIMRRRYTLPAGKGTKRRDPSVLTWQEMEEIARACKGESFEPAFLLMAFGGMRRSEACAIAPSDIAAGPDGSALVTISRKVLTVRGEVLVEETLKTEASARTVPVLSPWGNRLLELKAEALKAGRIWMLQDGERITNPNTVSKRYDDWFKYNPHRRVPMSNLRNSYTTAMITAGVDAALVSKLMGHSSVNVTYKHYLRPDAEAMAQLLSRFVMT